jgi:uncharacterized membrane protein
MAVKLGSMRLDSPVVVPAAARTDVSAPPALTIIARALLVLFGVGLSVGLAFGVLVLKEPLSEYLTRNEMRPWVRRFVLGLGFGCAVVSVFGGLALARVRRWEAPFLTSLDRIAKRASPLGVMAFVPLLFQWKVWKDRDLSFLALVAFSSFVFEVGLRTAFSTEPFGWEALIRRRARRIGQYLTDRFPKAASRAPVLIVCVGFLAYSAYFSFYTIAWCRAVRSSYDLGLENNLMWNLIHGNQFFKSSPLVGPTGSHFGYHATLFALLMAPVYALAPRPETLLAIQSIFIGAASVPLFLWARRRVSAALACALALGYLLYPSIHNANLYEFHYLPLGTFFLWLTLYAVEAKKNALAVVAILVTLTVREDVAAMLGVIGAYLLVSGTSPKAGLAIAILGLGYFVAMKMVVMPAFAGTEAFTFMFAKLMPAGENSFGGVLKTVFGNPWYTLGTLVEEGKLVYLAQILVPLAFIPMRRALSLVLALPGFLFTLLSTEYSPLISLHYQYTTYWTTCLFIALVLVLSQMESARRGAAVGALALSLVATSFQYGSILQTNTSWGGPIPYKFGMDRDGINRRKALDAILVSLPPRAKVVASGMLTVQVSSRPDAYTLTLGVYDAEYLLFPSERGDFIGDERQTVTRLLSDGTFGVIARERPFALARRGAPTARNEELLRQIR